VGCTIFEGDRLSTGAGGILRITIPSLTLQLGGQSSMELGHAAGAQANILAELGSGTLVLSAAPTGTIVVAANEAPIRILVSIAVAVAAGIAIPVIIHDVESPDRPGPTPPKKP
jgi:hypothetical protein